MPRRERRRSSARSGAMPSHRATLHPAWGGARLYALNHDAHGVRVMSSALLASSNRSRKLSSYLSPRHKTTNRCLPSPHS